MNILKIAAAGSVLMISQQALSADSLLAVYCLDDTDGATIYVDGKAEGSCSGARELISLSAGQHTVEVVRAIDKEYEQRFTESVTLSAGKPGRVRVALPEKSLTAYGKKMAADRELNERIAREKADFDKALKKARNGNPDAMQKVAAYYEQGYGTIASAEKAGFWRDKSTEIKQKKFTETLSIAQDKSAAYSQRETAMRNVSRYYRDGYGTEASSAKASEWSRKLSELQNEERNRKKTARKNAQIARARSEINQFKFFHWTRLPYENYKKDDAGAAATSVTFLPLSLAFDIVSMPGTSTVHLAIGARIKNIESQASLWANPDSMIAQASVD